MTDETKPKQPWTPGPISEEYIRAAFRHVSKQTDLDGLGLEHLMDAISDGSINIPTCYGGDPKLYAAAPVMAKALAAVIEPAEDVRNELRAVSAGCEAYVSALDEALATCRAALELAGWKWGGR